MAQIDEKISKEFQEYKKFAFNQNMMGVAIGLILATAFQKTVTGFSNYLIMPTINYFLSDKGNWRELVVSPLPGMNIEIGHLISTLIDFIVLSLILYFVWYKMLKWLYPPEEKKEEEPLKVEVIYLKRDETGNWKLL